MRKPKVKFYDEIGIKAGERHSLETFPYQSLLSIRTPAVASYDYPTDEHSHCVVLTVLYSKMTISNRHAVVPFRIVGPTIWTTEMVSHPNRPTNRETLTARPTFYYLCDLFVGKLYTLVSPLPF